LNPASIVGLLALMRKRALKISNRPFPAILEPAHARWALAGHGRRALPLWHEYKLAWFARGGVDLFKI
jgi:hypothetical protein